MPIGEVILPENVSELNSKLSRATQETDVINAIYEHLKVTGKLAGWEQSHSSDRDIDLKKRKCIVYLVRGKFEVGHVDGGYWSARDGGDRGYKVEDEATLRLHRNGVVIIIYT